ncbi:protein phosphatase 2C 7-like [Bidens hawaiensis]|uniref:protein phosphatase 2C 7-like n=1 Tax=Bidens hawaiensis TaxID=980011 RepID=UPI004049B692
MGLIEEMTLTKIALLTSATTLLSDHVPVFLDGSSNDLSIIQEIGSNGLVNDDVMIQENISKEISLGKETIESAIGLKASVVVVADKNHSKTVRSVFELEYVPLYGSHSVCGRRTEMEDTVSSVPAFTKIPVKMLVGDRVINGINTNLTELNAHFFGVYDGHGGCQVANYCRDRVHIALEEEIKVMKQELIKGTTNETVQVQWEKTFTSCFKKVDDDVGGKTSSDIDGSDTISEPVAPETVGSTAVVALICSSHIIVANCGDSRAVLYRGKEAIALSNDHKPNREDEYARIEAAGGKVIQWNGHRVLGVLAMSRSIGDGYLKPSIIPEPEVTFTPRARDDECLILASDGLWDVISNQEACEVAKRRILIWHKKNGGLPVERAVGGPDLAAQAAAEYLTMLAMQKGSKDNISVIVVDLKSQRKLKAKPG